MERGLERKECSKEKNKYMFKIQKSLNIIVCYSLKKQFWFYMHLIYK